MELMRQALAGSSPELDIAHLDLNNAYAEWSETYDGPNPLIMAEEPAVRGFVEGLPPGRALDVACGTGRLASMLSDLGHEVVGVDRSAEMLGRATSKFPSVTWIRGEATHLPLADASLDLAVCGLAMTHVVDLSVPIGEMARVLRPGGHAVISDIHPIAVATGTQAFFDTAEGDRGVTRNEVHWPSEYIQAAIDAGLAVAGCVEPRYRAVYAEEISDPGFRDAAVASFVGLPFAIVWSLRRS
jgi:ubiquinone/menaquinone biosynthesis C-methylase UbiE